MADTPLYITETLVIPAHDLTFEYSRSGGPGGQHVNKTETRVRLRFALKQCEALSEAVKTRLIAQHGAQFTRQGELILACGRFRSRHRNENEVRVRLAQLIRDALKPPVPRKKTRVSKNAKRKRVESKRRNSEKKKLRKNVRWND